MGPISKIREGEKRGMTKGRERETEEGKERRGREKERGGIK